MPRGGAVIGGNKWVSHVRPDARVQVGLKGVKCHQL